MDFEEATQCTQNTQGVVDPRRLGRNNSGLSEADISDVMCILHPCSPAAFKIVADTANRTPYNVLQTEGFENDDDGLTQSVLEEQATFIMSKDGAHQAMDLALRFSARTKNPKLGFVFGRNENQCDIVLAADLFKRVSNAHFSIFVNNSGVLMLQDMSTNGTVVDDIVLKGKAAQIPQTRMLNPGSMIQILSPKPEEVVKFIVRFPSREGHIEEYEAKFQAYLHKIALAEARARQDNLITQRLAPANPKTHNGGSIKAPLVQNQHGMHWSGGDRYNVVGLIGKGAFATVYQLATKSEGQLFAAKELEKRRFIKNGVLDRKLDNEMRIMKAVSHQNIVQYVDYQDHVNHMYIIMEFVPCGDLQQYMALHGPLTEPLGKKMAAQVLDALAYLHKKQITHRDLKPDNILISNMDPDEFTVKLSDFGLSKVVKDDETFLKTFCGTLLYCAPEVFPHYDSHVAHKGKKRTRRGTAQQSTKYHSYSQSVDIWSFGAVLWYSLCLKPPFEGVADNTGQGMFDKIMMTPLDATNLLGSDVSDDAVALLVEMLNTDPAARPSAAYCLGHRWFGGMRTSFEHSGAGADEDGLVPIVEEEEEAEPLEEPDMSGLSLDEQESNPESQTSEVSIHSGSLDFLDPRQSKRFKSDAHAYREPDDLLGSSPDLSYQSIQIIHQPTIGHGTVPQTQPAQPKLFGEISQSALESSTVLGRRAIDAVEISRTSEEGQATSGANESNGQSQQAVAGGALASPSLLGTESMVRELNMASPHPSNSQDAEPNELVAPITPGVLRQESRSQRNGTPSIHGEEDVTPKQPQRPIFNRQINIPIPASFYYDPLDPTTHNLEYASKVSGRDYLGSQNNFEMAEDTSLPTTMSGSATENEDEADLDLDQGTTNEQEPASVSPQPSQFLKPPPRLGKLVSTEDSFASITLNLSARISSWGRAPSNTHPHPDKHDTRVPKRGIIIWHFAKDIEKIPEDDQAWMKLPDLHCLISTESSQGIYINGILLKKGEPARPSRGRIYTGDEITVYQKGQDGKSGLKFICEFYHGEAKEQRPKDAPRFQLETVVSQQRWKGKEKEKVNVIASEQVAAA